MKSSLLLLAVFVTACAPATTTEQGPTLHVKLDPTGSPSATSDTDSDPHLNIDTTTMVYEFDLIVETRDGEVDSIKSSTEYQPVTMITGTITVPGQTVETGPFDMPSGSNRTYMRTTPISLPATVRNMTMNVKFEGECANGLSSNLIDFNVALR